MRNAFFASAIALLAAFVLMLAGPAMAQPKVSGSAAASFGQASWDNGTDSGSGMISTIESNVIFSGADQNMDYYFRIRARGVQGSALKKNFGEATFNDGQLQTVRVRVGWNATDTFRVEMGRLPGIGGTGAADWRAVRAPSGFRHYVNNLGFWDTGAINLQYKSGGIKAGLAIGANCQVDCSGGAAGGNVYEQSTIMPHINVQLGGGMHVAARYAMSSSTVDTGAVDASGAAVTESVSSSGMVLEFGMKTDAFALGVEVTSLTAGCIGSGCDDVTTQDIALAVGASGFKAQFSQNATDLSSTTTVTTSVISAWYEIPVGGGIVFPEVATRTQTTDISGAAVSPDDVTGTMIRFGAKTGF